MCVGAVRWLDFATSFYGEGTYQSEPNMVGKLRGLITFLGGSIMGLISVYNKCPPGDGRAAK